MPRSLIKHAVHPPYNITPKTKSTWRSYIMVMIGIIVVILFCDSLFHSNDPQSSYLYNDISSYFPVQLPNTNNIDSPHIWTTYQQSDSLENILRPIRAHNGITQPQTKHILQSQSESESNEIPIEVIEPESIAIAYTDYWDFPLSSQVKPTDTSSARHIGEYSMHMARVKWFNDNYKSKNKQISDTSNLIIDFKTRCPVFKSTKYCQWTPALSELCNWTNNAIFWHSMHGTMIGGEFRLGKPGEHFMWHFANQLKTAKTCTCPENVAFVFADNQEKDMRLSERSLIFCNENCNFYRVANDYNPWDWFGKIGPLLELIDTKEFKALYEYVVLIDADDQTLIKSPINIIDAFEFYNASIVIAGEATSWPNWQGREKGFENAVYPWSRHHQHLNAGGFMGKIESMIPYLKWMEADYNNFTIERAQEIKERGRNFWRDQTVWRTMHRLFYPDIKIDSFAKLWSRTDVYMYDL